MRKDEEHFQPTILVNIVNLVNINVLAKISLSTNTLNLIYLLLHFT